MSDIVDRISELVDESLSRPIVDDYSVNRFDRCPHCNRQWHGMPLTQQIAEMYARGIFDETYRVDTDDSRILCPGSDFIGPVQAPNVYVNQVSGVRVRIGSSIGSPLGRALRTITDINRSIETLTFGYAPLTRQRWWRATLPDNATIITEYHTTDTNYGTWIVSTDIERHTIAVEIGDMRETFDSERVRTRMERDDEITPQSITRVTQAFITMDVLQELPPRIGGTWQPLTAPGVSGHPDDRVSYSHDGLLDQEQLHRDGWADIGHIADDRDWFGDQRIHCIDCGIALSPGPDMWHLFPDEDSDAGVYVCLEHYMIRQGIQR